MGVPQTEAASETFPARPVALGPASKPHLDGHTHPVSPAPWGSPAGAASRRGSKPPRAASARPRPFRASGIPPSLGRTPPAPGFPPELSSRPPRRDLYLWYLCLRPLPEPGTGFLGLRSDAHLLETGPVNQFVSRPRLPPAPEAVWVLPPHGFCHWPGRRRFRHTYAPIGAFTEGD